MPILCKHFGRTVDPDELDAIVEALREFRPADLDQAFAAALRECAFFPKVAEIRARALAIEERRSQRWDLKAQMETWRREREEADRDGSLEEAQAQFYSQLEQILGLSAGTLRDKTSRLLQMDEWERQDLRRRRQHLLR